MQDRDTTSKGRGFPSTRSEPQAHPIGVLERNEANASFWRRAYWSLEPSSRDTALNLSAESK